MVLLRRHLVELESLRDGSVWKINVRTPKNISGFESAIEVS